jgi:hypothetical protein
MGRSYYIEWKMGGSYVAPIMFEEEGRSINDVSI